MSIKSRLSGVAAVIFGPLRQLTVRLANSRYDEDGNISLEYMESVNNAIPYEISEFVEWFIDVCFPAENYKFGDCHHIWSRTKMLYLILCYKWYSPDEIGNNDSYI